MATNQKQNSNTISEINITPLADVLLVLLIIFMVTAPMLKQGIQLNLPDASPRNFDIAAEEQIIVSISQKSELFLNGDKLTMENLMEVMTKVAAEGNQRTVFLEADEKVLYGEVIKVMDTIKRAGVENLGMVTEPEKK